MLLRKEKAGSDSYGHVWENDGSVVEVSEEEARTLLRITDGGFSEVTVTPEEISESPIVARTPVRATARRPAGKGIDVTTFTE